MEQAGHGPNWQLCSVEMPEERGVGDESGIPVHHLLDKPNLLLIMIQNLKDTEVHFFHSRNLCNYLFYVTVNTVNVNYGSAETLLSQQLKPFNQPQGEVLIDKR